MRVADWAIRLAGLPQAEPLLAAEGRICWNHIAPEMRPVMVACVFLKRPRTTLIITPTYDRALAWQARLELCGVAREHIRQLPSGSSSLFEDASPEQIAESERIGALLDMARAEMRIVIATPQGVLERTLPKDVLLESDKRIESGSVLAVEDLSTMLIRFGYEHSEPVRLPGQFSRRGGIMDVFITASDLPVRIELYGDVVESIRTFDPTSQRSVAKLDVMTIKPSRETLMPGDMASHTEAILRTLDYREAELDATDAERLRGLVERDVACLDSNQFFDRLDLYRPFLFAESECAIDLLPSDGVIFLDEPLELESVASRAADELGQALETRIRRGEMLPCSAHDFMLPPEHLADGKNVVGMESLSAGPEWLAPARSVDVHSNSLKSLVGRADLLTEALTRYVDDGQCVVLSSDQPNRARAVLAQIDRYPQDSPVESIQPGLYMASGNLAGGFSWPEAGVAFISDTELFGVGRLRLPQKRFLEGAQVTTLLDLVPGDYVVHIQYGIGVFRGLAKRTVEGVEKEFLYIEYAAPDKLFVPADQLDRVQKYLTPGDVSPKINRLTGSEWQKTMFKAKEEAQAFARDLVKVYALRQGAERSPCGPDTAIQREMEDTFPWIETPGQMRAIEDVKQDMRMPFPMDRLICGDVGFGKTEVGIRAAFKAVQEGRQVAVLCPTTILSEQHFRNFSERMSGFGASVALINRFTHASARRDLLEDLTRGSVDVIVGTHALLGAGVKFKNLALLIIDEEQKFGVKQKEMLKRLRAEVDILTLSATPIPRTLSMALMDIRQMSLINDPPPGRLPVRTFVRPYSTEVVREAILREMARGGQVFYVYNRVDSISHVADRLRKLVPTARIGIGHGQMTEQELEPVMIGFIRGEIDILLSTTIIENGIDIANANTLIVEQADRLGLAQLYQLRGRVGRSDRQAYAYFLYSGIMDSTLLEGERRSGRTMTEGALARLQALQEFTSLGSGYSLAFRDLQIRGAGELLGARQSGVMMTVGYELYTQLIAEAVALLKTSVDGAPSRDGAAKDGIKALPPLELPVVALIPDDYIADQAQRLYFYQRLMACQSEKELSDAQAEIEDRYGRLPPPAKNAVSILSLRIQAREVDVEKITGKSGRLVIQFRDRTAIPPMAVSILAKANRECYFARDELIWPVVGDPIAATRTFVAGFSSALLQVSSARSRLQV